MPLDLPGTWRGGILGWFCHLRGANTSFAIGFDWLRIFPYDLFFISSFSNLGCLPLLSKIKILSFNFGINFLFLKFTEDIENT